MKALWESSKKIHGPSFEKALKIGGAKMPENVRWLKLPGYCDQFGKENAFVAAAG